MPFVKGNKLSKVGSFDVRAIQLEKLHTIANHKLLFQLASITGGELFYPNQLKRVGDSLKRPINNREDYKDSVILNVVWFSILVVFLLLNVVPAILIANVCSKGDLLNMVIAFLFSDIYVFNYAIRKFVYEDNYCSI